MKARKVSTPMLAKATGIPQDRIYAWYRDNTTPKAGDKEKLEGWINGEISNTGEGQTPEEVKVAILSHDQILSVLATAYQGQVEILRTQTTILEVIKKEMATRGIQEVMIDKLDKVSANLIETLAGVEFVSGRQLKKILDHLQGKEPKEVPAAGGRKKQGVSDGDGHR